MAFGKTYAEILEMVKNWVLDVNTCRDIARRAGVFPMRAGEFAAPVEVFRAYPDTVTAPGSSDEYELTITSVNVPSTLSGGRFVVPHTGLYELRMGLQVSLSASRATEDQIYLRCYDIDNNLFAHIGVTIPTGSATLGTNWFTSAFVELVEGDQLRLVFNSSGGRPYEILSSGVSGTKLELMYYPNITL